MTNEQAKQEAIKKAYGKYYQELKAFINNDGWVLGDDALYTKYNRSFDDIDFSNFFGNQSWRPIELSNLENNNGWIRIEPDGSNLPTEENGYRVILKSGNISEVYYDPKEYLSFKPFTHYKPIIPEPKPIY